MIIKGIQKGDHSLRHFTFDDEDYEVRGGVYYYKVTYDKNPLEGEYGEDEIGYVECSKVIPLGGKKPRPIPKKNETKITQKITQTPVQDPEPEVKKRGRKPKVTKIEEPAEAIPVAPQGGIQKFDYHVTYLGVDNRDNLEDELNKLGDVGWELCGFDTTRGMLGPAKIVAVFKRKRG